MSAYLFVPFAFIRFWYLEAPAEMVRYLKSFNIAFIQQFSLLLLLRTFFKPLKNEYREGLVWFSIAMGMFVKYWIIIIDLLLFAILLIFEIAILAAFLMLPLVTFSLLFVKINL